MRRPLSVNQCAGYPPGAARKQCDQGNLKKQEFILASGSRGLELILAGEHGKWLGQQAEGVGGGLVS